MGVGRMDVFVVLRVGGGMRIGGYGAEMRDHLWRMLERFVVWIFLKTFVFSVEFLF